MGPSAHHHHLLLLLVAGIAAAVLPLGGAAEGMSETEALIHLKKSFSNSSSVSSWLLTDNGGQSPCAPGSHEWHGVVCARGKVAGLRLSGLQLGGTIDVDALSSFPDLRSVSFAGNNFTGPLPSFHRLTALKSMFLSDNKFHGDIPDEFFPNLNHLKKLWLDGNELSGPIPASLAEAEQLIELHLERNKFSGELPPAPPMALKSFDVSDNDLDGVVPEAFRRFDVSGFRRNQYLCYVPTPGKPCKRPEITPESTSWLGVVLAMLLALAIVVVVVFSASGGQPTPVHGYDHAHKGDTEEAPPVYMVKQGSSTAQKRSMSWLGRRTGGSSAGGTGGGHRRASSAAKVDDLSTGGVAGDLVIVNDCKGVFGLTDLMKAAAQMIGSGGLGSAYKAVMANGVAVVVKRARDMNRATRVAFEAEMKRLGGIRHANLLPPLAYHYRKDEKLLVYEYIPKGNLLYVLHGDRSVDYAALDWPTRLKVTAGVARGAAFLHAELAAAGHDVPHGNLKSSNVLLAPDFEPLLVDFGYSSLVNYTESPASMFSRRAPECVAGNPASAKADVYCLGIVLLEILTGKFPSQYNANGGTDLVMWATTAQADGHEQDLFDQGIVTACRYALPDMKRLLQIAMECVEADLERRPDMKQAASRVEETVAAALATVRQEAPAHAAVGRDESMQRVTSAGIS
ncbi:hypothetical protein CFC21_096615 [Triticum aestivum]|uniref:Protein kinase domain-containing protein n=3 Tax=Triticum TaxID=4564 RepID=A0A9R1BK85_TRITD|nr:pollen receptor-like kinase 3 [Triticum aestivum]KAF7094297.1 hypothetical protein CFC21_096615 [Triticum aestivum]VAI71714.1 unnamed protein product [Triticum turgidum subsp. durum]